jgi:hypothetical protein
VAIAYLQDEMTVLAAGYRCSCCGISYSGGIKTDALQRQCEMCKAHALAGYMQKDAEHRVAWENWRDRAIAELSASKAAHAEDKRLSELKLRAAEIEASDLRRALEEGVAAAAPELIAKYFENEAVMAANRARDSAYRSRDRALGVIWDVDRVHHLQDKNNRCVCGNPSCNVNRLLVDLLPELYKWEDAQIARARESKPHGLPDHHPDSIKYGRYRR